LPEARAVRIVSSIATLTWRRPSRLPFAHHRPEGWQGHASPNITLKVYAHLFGKDDSKASDAINAALAGFGQT
jgi:hypothetical protein